MTNIRSSKLPTMLTLMSVVPVGWCLLASLGFAAEVRTPGPSPSDALFDPNRVIQIEIPSTGSHCASAILKSRARLN
jgi:hypothetical protein